MTRIKICGITNPADALKAAEMGAHALGFIFAPSPRQVSPETAASIIRELPAFVQTVGVFVNSAENEVREIMEYTGLDLVQFHGRETPEFCGKFVPRVIKSLSMEKGFDLDLAASYHPVTKAILLDTGGGGTGRTFDWALIPEELDRKKLILAGGLNPENIIQAIRKVRPWAVDTSSGIESTPGRKDFIKMSNFIANVREVDHDGS
jgi:phosphoribosylanthranilate isomerase